MRPPAGGELDELDELGELDVLDELDELVLGELDELGKPVDELDLWRLSAAWIALAISSGNKRLDIGL